MTAGWYRGGIVMTPKQVQALLTVDAKLPLPPDIGVRTLSSLWDRGLVRRHEGGAWSITEWGKKRVAEIRRVQSKPPPGERA